MAKRRYERGLTYKEALAEALKDPDFSAEYERQAPYWQLVALRIERGLSQAQVAERVGTSQSEISRLEAGKPEPNLATLRRVVEALDGCLVVEIYPREEAPARPCLRSTA